MPDNCSTDCASLEETTQGVLFSVTDTETDCINSLDDLDLQYAVIHSENDTLSLVDGSEGVEITVGGNESVLSPYCSNVLTSQSGKLTVHHFTPGHRQAVFNTNRGLHQQLNSGNGILFPDQLPDYDDASFSYQGSTISFSSENLYLLVANKAVRLCDGKESCNVFLKKLQIELE